MFILILTFISLCLLCWFFNTDYYILSLCKRIRPVDSNHANKDIKAIPGKSIFGNNLDLLAPTPAEVFQYIRKNSSYAKGKSYLLYFFTAPTYCIQNAEEAEAVLSNQTLIAKSITYDLIRPFLGDGLLLSSDSKWHLRRKILTPAFHFNILQNFLDIFKEESYKLLANLEKKVGNEFPINDIIAQFSLNCICETALGIKLDDTAGSEVYRKAIHELELSFVKRSCNTFMYPAFMFYLFGDYNKHQRDLKVAHTFSSQIINKRRAEFEQLFNTKDRESDEFGKKKRYAMLDTLLHAEFDGVIDHQGICEEVDTFMFEGYDTTSTCIIFSLFCLAWHPEIQEKCYQEMNALGNIDSLTIFDFNQLEYLECVIKETLRMYPSVPVFARECKSDMIINGLYLPKRAQVFVHVFDILRDPKHFPNPRQFDPDRFLPENTTKRHPFAHIPFSAGPRNCIGQKFALLEIKVILLAMLKHYEILPVTKLNDLTFQNGMVLRTSTPIQIQLKRRTH